MATREEVAAVKSKYSAELRKLKGVSGVGVEKDDSGGYVLAVHVNAEEGGEQIPEVVEGCPVKIIRSGPFRKFSD
jgi:hypothetical protein